MTSAEDLHFGRDVRRYRRTMGFTIRDLAVQFVRPVSGVRRGRDRHRDDARGARDGIGRLRKKVNG
jgi:hypothetical protein